MTEKSFVWIIVYDPFVSRYIQGVYSTLDNARAALRVLSDSSPWPHVRYRWKGKDRLEGYWDTHGGQAFGHDYVIKKFDLDPTGGAKSD